MIGMITTLWPIIMWVLKALGLSPESKEKEQEYRLRLLEAAERKDAATIEAFAEFQKLWRPAAERTYVWANTIIALFQPAIVTLAWYGFITGTGISRAKELNDAGFAGWLLAAVMLFPLYGPVIASSVGDIFKAGISAAVGRLGQNGKPATSGPTPPTPAPVPLQPEPMERERL